MYKAKKIGCALLCLCIVFFCGCAADLQGEEKIILRYAEPEAAGHPKAQAALEFARLVEQESKGRIQIRVYTEGELGDEKAAAEQVRLGGVDFSCVGMEVLQTAAPQLEILNIPYLFHDAQQMWELLDGETGKEYLDLLTEEGIAALAFYTGGTQHIYSRRQTRCLEDLKGLELLAGERSFEKIAVLLESQPVYTPISEAAAMLAAGKADGGESDLNTYLRMGLYEQAPYLLLTGHTRKLEVLIASPYTMQQLSSEDRALLADCAYRSAIYERELWAQQEKQARKELKEKGVIFTKVNEDGLEQLKAAIQPLYSALTQEQQKAVKRIRQAA